MQSGTLAVTWTIEEEPEPSSRSLYRRVNDAPGETFSFPGAPTAVRGIAPVNIALSGAVSLRRMPMDPPGLVTTAEATSLR